MTLLSTSLIRKLTLFLAVTLLSVSASAVNWIKIHNEKDEVYYVDKDSVSRSGNVARAFLKVVMNDTEMVILSDIYCNSNPISYKPLQVTALSKGESRPVNVGNSVEYPNPGTVFGFIYTAVCKATE